VRQSTDLTRTTWLMAITFRPKAGEILQCDFHGMMPPEMVKVRDVVIVAPHYQNRSLVAVVPLSTTAPNKVLPYHFALPSDPRPDGTGLRTVWAKCDMLYTFSTERLTMHHSNSRHGRRQAVRIYLPQEALDAIKRCIAFALNLPYNKSVPVREGSKV